MKTIKLLSFLACLAPLAASGCTQYNVDMILDSSQAYVYSYGAQSFTVTIPTSYIAEYNISFSPNVSASDLKDCEYLKGKNISLTRVSDKEVKVDVSGSLSYDLTEDKECKFYYYFKDSAFSKAGFHGFFGAGIYRSCAIYGSLFSKLSSNINFTLGFYGANIISYEGITLKDVGEGCTVSATQLESETKVSITNFSLAEGKTAAYVSFPASCFDIARPIDVKIKTSLYSTDRFYF